MLVGQREDIRDFLDFDYKVIPQTVNTFFDPISSTMAVKQVSPSLPLDILPLDLYCLVPVRSFTRPSRSIHFCDMSAWTT